MDILINDFVILLFVFIRITAMFFTAPFFSDNSFPTTVKLLFALVVAYIVFFSVKGFHFDVDKGIGLLVLYGLKEAITGMIIGYSLNFIFWGISFAGAIIGIDVGFGMAQLMNPSTDLENNIIGQIFYLFAVMLFIVLNGHHYLIRGIAASFSLIPIGTYTVNSSVIELLTKYSAGVFVLAIKIASPVIISFFLIHIALGVMSRIIPQMQVFFVVQPLHFVLGFLLLSTSAPILILIIRDLISGIEDSLFELLRAMSR
jgi:flagellar biosynthetic protein FliR